MPPSPKCRFTAVRYQHPKQQPKSKQYDLKVLVFNDHTPLPLLDKTGSKQNPPMGNCWDMLQIKEHTNLGWEEYDGQILTLILKFN